MKLIYPAGPISAPTLLQALNHIRAGQKVSTALIKQGYAVFPVFCDFLLQLQDPLDINHYKKSSIAWMEKADALCVIGKWRQSLGCLDEINRAHVLNIPVYFSVAELMEKMPPT